MLIAILIIVTGFWMTRWANRFEARRRREMFTQWGIEREISDNVLRTINALKEDRVRLLEVMSDRIRQEEVRKESILRDFKHMLYSS